MKTETHYLLCPKCQNDGVAIWNCTGERRAKLDLRWLSLGFESIGWGENDVPRIECASCNIPIVINFGARY